jgi:hypothetical protein
MRLLTWLVLAWELGFPLLVLMPRTRTAALLLGVAFHVGTGLALQLGPFPLYMLCLYLPLAPWERWADVRNVPRPGRQTAELGTTEGLTFSRSVPAPP